VNKKNYCELIKNLSIRKKKKKRQFEIAVRKTIQQTQNSILILLQKLFTIKNSENLNQFIKQKKAKYPGIYINDYLDEIRQT
jgi:hypothetical protein